MTRGGTIVFAAHASHDSIWRSVPQMPVLRTRMRTSLMPGTGTGTSRSVSPGPASVFTSASMAPLPAIGSRSVVAARVVRPVDDGILHPADALDLAPDAVAGLEEHGRVAEHADTCRRAGDHQVARLERDLLGDEADQLGHREQHVGGVPVLHQHRIVAARGDAPAAQGEAGGGVDLVRGDEHRADRKERVAALRAQPLAVALLALAEGR